MTSLATLNLSPSLPGQAILMKRPTSFQVADEEETGTMTSKL